MVKVEYNKKDLAVILRDLSDKAVEFQTAVDEIVKSEIEVCDANHDYCHNDVQKVVYKYNNYKVIVTVNTTGPIDVTFNLYSDDEIIVSAQKSVFEYGWDDNCQFHSLPGTAFWKFIGNIARLLNDVTAVAGNQEVFNALIAKREFVCKETVELSNKCLAVKDILGERTIEIAPGVHLNINLDLSLNFDINQIKIYHNLIVDDNKHSATGNELYLFFRLSYDYSEQEVLDCASEAFSEMLGHYVCDKFYN